MSVIAGEVAVGRRMMPDAERLLASGLNAFQTREVVVGKVTRLVTPGDVVDFVESGNVRTDLILTEGGATTFLSPALMAGALGILALTGAPESHLGILAREFQIPCALTVTLERRGARSIDCSPDERPYADLIAALVGRRVRLDGTDPVVARVFDSG